MFGKYNLITQNSRNGNISLILSLLWSLSFTVQLIHQDTMTASCFFQKRQNKNLLSAGMICLQAEDNDECQTIKRSTKSALLRRGMCSPMQCAQEHPKGSDLGGETMVKSFCRQPTPSCLLETCSLKELMASSYFYKPSVPGQVPVYLEREFGGWTKVKLVQRVVQELEVLPFCSAVTRLFAQKSCCGRLGPYLSQPGHKDQSKVPTKNPATWNA